jgi:predicted membrane-bound spermidine synthase
MLAILIVAEALVAFCVLGFEVAVARLLAPYVGLSTDTWTAIIAAFLLALALGNRIGGSIAARCDLQRLPACAAVAAALAAAVIAATPFAVATLDALIVAPGPTQLWRIALFAALPCLPCGFLLGVATPLLMMAAMGASRQSGMVVGTIYAAGAIGSVSGVLAVLWILLDWLGTTGAILAIGAVAIGVSMVLAGAACAPRRRAAWA